MDLGKEDANKQKKEVDISVVNMAFWQRPDSECEILDFGFHQSCTTSISTMSV